MKKMFFAVIVLIAAGAGIWWYVYGKAGKTDVQYRTSPLRRMRLVQDISASGTIQPIKEVLVGAQVNGKILRLHVDYNSKVKAGQVLAEIDPATYQANLDSQTALVNSARASCEAAEARLQGASAAVLINQSKLKFARRELVRIQRLYEKKMVSEAELDTIMAQCEQLAAQVEGNQADILQARASVSQAAASVMQHEASRRQAQANLNYCTIHSPVDGIVLARQVDEGQTVVSNMSASPLLTLATDLTRIQLEASVPEADIGQVRRGQRVEFTVDTYHQKFTGVVKDIRLAAVTESNVVTYPVIIEADNPGGKLFPGMTATLSIIVREKADVLAVSAAVIRYQGPAGKSEKPGIRGKKAGVGGMRTIWLLGANGAPEPVKVKLGISDGVFQEIITDEKLENRKGITGILNGQPVRRGGTVNPFSFRRHLKKK